MFKFHLKMHNRKMSMQFTVFCNNRDTKYNHSFSDDNAVVGQITDGNDKEYRELTRDFVD